jgi:hypothetical protein
VLAGLTRLIRPLALMTLIKNLGHHTFVEELLGIGGLHLILNLSRKARMLGMCMVIFR